MCIGQGNSDGGYIKDTSFNCGPHGTRIMNTDCHIGSMIYTRDQQVGFPIQYFVHCQLNTVYRSARTTVLREAFLFLYKGVVNRSHRSNGTGHAGTGSVRSKHYNITYCPKTKYQFFNSFCLNTIVVCDQDQRSVIHHTFIPFNFVVKVQII